MVNTLFSEDKIPKRKVDYVCIAAICIDSILRASKKSYPQVYLEQCKYEIKKRELVSIIHDEVDISSNKNDFDEQLSLQIECFLVSTNHLKMLCLVLY